MIGLGHLVMKTGETIGNRSLVTLNKYIIIVSIAVSTRRDCRKGKMSMLRAGRSNRSFTTSRRKEGAIIFAVSLLLLRKWNQHDDNNTRCL